MGIGQESKHCRGIAEQKHKHLLNDSNLDLKQTAYLKDFSSCFAIGGVVSAHDHHLARPHLLDHTSELVCDVAAVLDMTYGAKTLHRLPVLCPAHKYTDPHLEHYALQNPTILTKRRETELTCRVYSTNVATPSRADSQEVQERLSLPI